MGARRAVHHRCRRSAREAAAGGGAPPPWGGVPAACLREARRAASAAPTSTTSAQSQAPATLTLTFAPSKSWPKAGHSRCSGADVNRRGVAGRSSSLGSSDGAVSSDESSSRGVAKHAPIRLSTALGCRKASPSSVRIFFHLIKKSRLSICRRPPIVPLFPATRNPSSRCRRPRLADASEPTRPRRTRHPWSWRSPSACRYP